MTSALSARRPGAGAGLGPEGDCLAARTSPAPFVQFWVEVVLYQSFFPFTPSSFAASAHCSGAVRANFLPSLFIQLFSPFGGLLRLARIVVELHQPLDGFAQAWLAELRDLGFALFHPFVALYQQRLGLVVLLVTQQAAAQH